MSSAEVLLPVHQARGLKQRLHSALRCFLVLQSINIKARFSYTLDAWFQTLVFMVQQLTGLLFLYVVFSRVQAVAEWTLPEIVFIYALLLLSMSIYRLVFQGMRDTSFLVLDGSMDQLLTKPRDPLFLLSCRRSNTNGLADLVTGLLLIVLAGNRLDYEWTVGRVLQLGVFILSGNVIMVAIMTAQAALCFPLVQFTIMHDVVMALREYCQYPLTMYNPVIRILLWTGLPLAFCSYVPASVLLSKDGMSSAWTLGPPLVAAVSLGLSVALFRLGLRFYQSTGS